MVNKYFSLDKNYILETAQLIQKDVLLYRLCETVKKIYSQRFNPLGLIDDTILKIQSHELEGLQNLEEFYNTLSGVYRYKNGSNQLDLVFDGRDHLEVYKQEWEHAFEKWVSELCQSPYIIKTILELTVFHQDGNRIDLPLSRMQGYIHKKFDLKLYKFKGLAPMRVA
jgi:hypothetical protein